MLTEKDFALAAEILDSKKLFVFDMDGTIYLGGIPFDFAVKFINKLREIGLNVPIVTRVFDRLREKGLNVPNDVFTVENAVEALKKIKAGDRNA